MQGNNQSADRWSKVIKLEDSTRVVPLDPSVFIKEFKHNELRGLNVTFINMPLRESARPNVPPEGPAILAAILRQYGATPHIIRS